MKDFIERGDGSVVKCVTCNKVAHWKQMDGGHFIPKSYLHAYLDRHNAHNQCYACNVMKSGNILEYEDFILDTYGEAELKRLKGLRYAMNKITHEWIDEQERFFKDELARMEHGEGHDDHEYDSFLKDF